MKRTRMKRASIDRLIVRELNREGSLHLWAVHTMKKHKRELRRRSFLTKA